MTRIRYKRNPYKDNIYYSNQYLAGTSIINATIINRVDGDGRYQVIIHDLTKGMLLYEQLCQSFNSAKRVVKNKFKEVGVALNDEVRKKVE